VLFAWRRTRAGTEEGGTGGLKGIAVLPFENLGAAEDAYFAAGVTEEISSRLAGLKGLSVISRVTATGYDRRGKTIRQIGSDLGVTVIWADGR